MPPSRSIVSCFLYRTPYESFLFRKETGNWPINFSVRDDIAFNREIQHVFTSRVGRDVGVEALVCGQIQDVNLPLTPYNKSMDIQSGKIIGQLDMTDMIKNYHKAIHMPEHAESR